MDLVSYWAFSDELMKIAASKGLHFVAKSRKGSVPISVDKLINRQHVTRAMLDAVHERFTKKAYPAVIGYQDDRPSASNRDKGPRAPDEPLSKEEMEGSEDVIELSQPTIGAGGPVIDPMLRRNRP